jgi:hypothetical protein
VLFEREFIEAERAAYIETCVEDDEIALRMDAGRRILMARGVNEVGPYQSPMEDGMQHFHEWYRSNLSSRKPMASLWMLFASFMFALMGAGVKLAAEIYSLAEIVMYRGLFGTSCWATGRAPPGRQPAHRRAGRAPVAQRRRRHFNVAVVLRPGQAAAGHRRHAQLHVPDLDRRLAGRCAGWWHATRSTGR